MGKATGQLFKNTGDLVRSLRPFSQDLINKQIKPSTFQPKGFIELEDGTKIDIKSLVNKPKSSFAKLEDGTKIEFGNTQDIKKSFIDFGDRIEKINSVADPRKFNPNFFDPKNIQLPTLENLATSLEQNFNYFRGGVDDIVKAIKEQQTNATYNITIHAPKTIKQAQGSVKNIGNINFDNVLDQAKLLATGI